MASRDNTKPLTPTLRACPPGGGYGQNPTLRNIARPGSRNNKRPKGAESVMSANGQTPRPGYKQKKVQGGGTGSVARPGYAQGINRGVNK